MVAILDGWQGCQSQFRKSIPAQLGLIWINSFYKGDFNEIFYKKKVFNLHNQHK